jgi:cobyrinic acid a,c-diamide synthase
VEHFELPRVVIAGLAGDSGKTFFSIGVAKVLRERGLNVAPFKKGPDFIDAAWLGMAAGSPARNLDTFLMPADAIHQSLSQASTTADIAIIEGNRGLYDGMDAEGSHSTAELAKRTGTPVVLVVNVFKATRTVAALIRGCEVLDPEVPIAGVILNNVGTNRQENVIRQAIANATDVPVLGMVPRFRDQNLPSRHLGLVTAMEHPNIAEALEKVAAAVKENVDIAAIVDLAGKAPALATASAPTKAVKPKVRVRIGVLKDKAFTFYYPENLEALEYAGAELVPISPLQDKELPSIDGLYAGGGFPEVYASELSANRTLRGAIKKSIGAGMPVWAECGGLIYLSKSLTVEGTAYPMAGVLPVSVGQVKRPQGHGYVRAKVDGENPYFENGTQLLGHEFHYTRLLADNPDVPTVLQMERGTGIGGKRDGIHIDNVVATYTHLHALGVPDWAPHMVRATMGRR